MAQIKPFSGIRYDTANITKLICPPYDIIGKEEKENLKKLSANNMVRLELPDEEQGLSKYANSSRLFSEWMKKGVLVLEGSPSLYFYEQHFKDHGRKMLRRGFSRRLNLKTLTAGL